MSTGTTPKSTKSLNTKQRDWLKQMGATLGTRSTAGAADKALVGGIFDVVPDPINTTITIKNNSPFILQIVPKSAKPESPPSDFVKAPPLEIAANRGEGTFTLSNKLLGKIPSPGGTGGQVQYDVVGDPNRTRLFFKWERGFLFPSRETTQTVTPKDESKFKVEGFNSGGDDFAFIFTAVGAVPPPGPLPGPTPVGPDAASSCMVTIQNDTKLVLTLGGQGHERGDFMTFPAKTLQPGGNTSFVSVETPNSKDPKDEGCKGFALWQVGSPDVLWRVEWDNPEGSKNIVSASFNPPNAGFTSLNQIGQGEENVPVAFTISGGGGGQTPPTPTTTGKLLVTVTEDTTSKPVEGATVAVNDKTAKTDKAGKTDFELPAGNHDVRVTADGFEEGRANATIKNGEKTDLAVFLRKAAELEFNPPTSSKQPTLRKGDKSEDGWVEYLQNLLTNVHQIAKLEITGTYDPPTVKAVTAFQTKKGLQVDGTVGNQTWAALREGAPEKVGTDGRQPHTFVERGAEARWDQEKGICVYVEKDDLFSMFLTSVGDAKIDDFEATLRITPPNTKPRVVKVRIGKPGKVNPTGGASHDLVIQGFKKKFPASDPAAKVDDYHIEAFLPQELGGDRFDGKPVV